MSTIIVFFRDVLSGSLYTITTVISSILICACLGYIIDKKEKKRVYQSQFAQAPQTPDGLNYRDQFRPRQAAAAQNNNRASDREVAGAVASPEPEIKQSTVIFRDEVKPMEVEEKVDTKAYEKQEEEPTTPKVQAPIPIGEKIQNKPLPIEEPLAPNNVEEVSNPVVMPDNNSEEASNPIPMIQ